MLDATSRCSLAGLCFCLLAISAAALTSSTTHKLALLKSQKRQGSCEVGRDIIYHVLLLLSATLAIGCPLFSRLLIPSQAKPVTVKRHRRRGRLRPDTVANDSVGDSVHGALVTDTTLEFFAFSAKFFILHRSFETKGVSLLRHSDSGSFQRKWISDGIVILSNWLKCQQVAFCEAA